MIIDERALERQRAAIKRHKTEPAADRVKPHTTIRVVTEPLQFPRSHAPAWERSPCRSAALLRQSAK